MNRDQIIEKVNKILNQDFEIPLEQLTPEATIFEDLALDSLDAVDMLVYLEDNLKMKVDAELFKEVRKLEDIYQLIEKLLKDSKSS